VSAADPLVMCPRFIRMVKENGLVCMTYGVLNNDPKNVLVNNELLKDYVHLLTIQ
jgi:glycerophosphodiester phosphodiesterase